ncbi:NADH dehydrogenase [Collibacillus ludicampi]|uniref:NADH dehydrogenase n=1 Tax=Collibacillus ludicampi TaxID=2771369 RepID=A0AAV4LER6_9BACL|nr:nitroreductase family protein [Collibacillus ludicampi]GIM46275.1 NADH dehydrogenase [Collibacillus ludicampi]
MSIIQLLPEIEERSSITNWSSKSISEETWEILFEAARRAPSSWNRQPARYVVVSEENVKKSVCNALHRTNKWAEKAAGLIVQVADPVDDDRLDGKDYYLYDCGLSMMSLIYQAQSMGITTRQMIGFDEKDMKQILGIPDRYRIVVIAGLGYPSESPVSMKLAQIKHVMTEQHKRYRLEHLVSWQKWGGKSK